MKTNLSPLHASRHARGRSHRPQSVLRHRLKASLAFSSSLCCLTVSQNYAAVLAEEQTPDVASLTTTTLGVDSGYTLQKGTATNGPTITKYIIDPSTGALTAESYNVTINPLGDDAGDTTLYFKWEEVTTDGRTYKKLTETDTLEAGGVSVKVDSSLNKRVTETIPNIDNSFAGITASDTENATSSGGALSSTVSSTIEGDFVGNSILPLTSTEDNFSGGAMGTLVKVDSIKGTFVGNVASDFGGAIIHYDEQGGKNSIQGDFIANTVTKGSGGAIAAEQDEIVLIKGDFIANSAGSQGGAMFFDNIRVTTVTGDYFSNSAGKDGGAVLARGTTDIFTLTGDFIGNTAGGNGGAMSVDNSDFGALTGNFIANSAKSHGGAIYNFQGSVGLLAASKSIYLTGNTANGVSNAIYSFGYFSTSEMFLNSYAGNRIVVNDGIDGYQDGVDNQIININNGMSNLVAYKEEGRFSTVEFNNDVKNHVINVNAGTLKLGTFDGATLGSGQKVTASTALLTNTKLNVSAGATVDAHSGVALGESASANVITNSGTITYDKGTLVNDLKLTDGGLLALKGSGGSSSKISVTGTGNKITGEGRSNHVSGTVAISAGASLDINLVALSANTVVTNASARTDVTLTNGIVTDIVLGESRVISDIATSSLAGYAGVSSSVDLQVYDMLNVGAELNALTIKESITFDIPMTKAQFDSHFVSSTTEKVLVFQFGEGDDAFGNDYSAALNNGLEVYLNIEGKLYKATYEYVNADGSLALGFTADSKVIPEPSTATLSLISLAGLLARRRRRAI